MGLFFRGLTGRLRIFPEFIIVGVQKGGTTSLFAYLDQHPDLKLSRPKEVHFFDDEYEKGMGFYKRYFPLAISGKRTGEASPYYIFHPLVADRIKRELPNTKILVVLRNPILRAYSHFQMQKRQGLEPLDTFDEAIDAENDRLQGERQKMLDGNGYNSINYKRFSYAKRGMYAEQVERWIDVFGRENIHFIKSELLNESPQDELIKVYDFLRLRQALPTNFGKKHVHSYSKIDETTFNKLREMYLEDQEKLVALLGEQFKWI